MGLERGTIAEPRGPALTGEAQNVDAEMALIGALMIDGAVALAVPHLKTADFFDPALGRIWGAAVALVQSDRAAHASVLNTRLAEDPTYRELGGPAFLMQLLDRAPPPSAAVALAADVTNAARLRRLQAVGFQLSVDARQGVDAFDLITATEREITSMLREAAPPSVNLIDAASSAAATVERLEQEARYGRPKGAMTGLRCFDRRMRGLRPGWLLVLAGRPSMGKTALARVAALGCARRNIHSRVLFFALEMGRDELDDRTLSHLTRVAGDNIAYKDMSGDVLPPEDRTRVAAAAELVPSNLLIDDSPILSVDYVRRRVLAERRAGPIAAVFIDYLQIMQMPDARGRNEASVIGEMTQALKQLAREANCCVVLLSQINRGVEGREDKRPQLSDLRASGSIEQDANAVCFVYREAYYLERSPPQRGSSAEKMLDWEMACHDARHRLDVICAKVRGAAIGIDEQHYEPAFDYIADVEERP